MLPENNDQLPKLHLAEEKLWEKVESDVISAIKQYLIKTHPGEILKKFKSRINSVVSVYLRKLPTHVATSEGDDLANVARIEFLEALRVWDPRKGLDPWPLALARMTGAMRDHLRYLTKADPSRLYDWVTSAAYIYMTVNSSAGFETKIERGIQLKSALELLSEQERKIVVWHYKDDHTFKEIGDKVELSESQVSRIYNQAVSKIKKTIQLQN
ncbi:MAG: sigma-70 family RNA polymerase sigma factor [Candidatus Margulisiibacteriota bacterium]